MGSFDILLTVLTAVLLGAGLHHLSLDAALRRRLQAAATAERRSEREASGGTKAAPFPPWMSACIRMCEPIGLMLTTDAARQALEQRLRSAGRPLGFDVRTYLGARVCMALTGLFLGLSWRKPTLAGLMAVGGWFLIGQWLSGRISDRQAKIRAELPDFLDSVAICLSAGAPVETALQDVTTRYSGPLREEMEEVLAQIALGVPRQQAFRALLAHNPSRELEAVVLSLIHGMQLGVPLSEALQAQAKALRSTRAQRARQMAGASAPRITLISTLMITPAVLYFIIGLLALNFMLSQDFAGFRGLLGM